MEEGPKTRNKLRMLEQPTYPLLAVEILVQSILFKPDIPWQITLVVPASTSS